MRATPRKISETANMPIMMGMSVRPPASSALPNVKRGNPAGLSSPTQATSRPRSRETTPFSGLASAMNTAHRRPSTTSQKYSNEENLSATSASAGAARMSTAVPKSPPITENTSPAPSASSAWPLRVIAYASSVYAAEAGVPGMRKRQLGMSPAKMAIAVAVTIDAIAGTGSMKNVTGTRSAVAIVAVSPGTAPTNSPNTAEPKITPSTYGSSTSLSASKSIALEQSPRQRNPQQLVERKMNHDRGHNADRQGYAPRPAEHSDPEREQRHANNMKTELLGGQHVEHQAGDHARHAEERPAAADPVGQRQPRPTPAYAADDQEHSTAAEASGDQAGKPGRAEPLAWHFGKPLDVPEDRGGERDERRARHRIIDPYLASPTALSALPRFLSDSAMNFVVPAGSAQITPKPRLAMNSLYSFES